MTTGEIAGSNMKSDRIGPVALFLSRDGSSTNLSHRISGDLWNEMQPGRYRELLCERGNIRAVLVDNAVDSELRDCCARVSNCDRLLSITSHSELESWARELGLGSGLTVEMLDVLAERFVGRAGPSCRESHSEA